MLINNSEKIFFLKHPRLVRTFSSSRSLDLSLEYSSNSFSPLSDNDIQPSLHKDKKNRSVLQPDMIEAKKSKNKLNKKNRKLISVDPDDLMFTEKSAEVLTSNALNRSLPKSSKNNKQRKRTKIKSNNSLNNISDYLNNNNHQKQDDNIKSKDILIDRPLVVQHLSSKLNVPETEIITYLFLRGFSATINQIIDIQVASQVAKHYGFIVHHESTEVNPTNSNESLCHNFIQSIKRPPIVAILGHVDHGKTTLLNSILKTNLTQRESGGITQSLDGYEIDWPYNSLTYRLVFIDTPGHEAFVSMRSRGVQVADIVLLIVAADDGLKSQTIESIKYILNKKLLHIVAINKVDKFNSNVSKIREDLAAYDIVDKSWGGQSSIIEISALKDQNINLLLDNICMLADSHNFTANPDQLAQGIVLEANLDKQKGVVANLIVQEGTLSIGDFIVSGIHYGRIKMIFDSCKNKIQQALPSSVLQVLGFSSIPQAGMSFQLVNNEKEAKRKSLDATKYTSSSSSVNMLNNRITLESFQGLSVLKQVHVILKTNTQGSMEALMHSFSAISQEKVQINVVSASSTSLSNTDLDMALASNSIILGFNIYISSNIRSAAKKSNIVLQNFEIIYDLIDYLNNYMLDLLDPEYDQVLIGTATVQTTFSVNRGFAAGCLVNTGKLQSKCTIEIYRNAILMYTGILDSLKHIKDDISEVIVGNECGLMCINYHSWQKDDVIKAYELKEKDRIL
uniref:Translation initiation factor IF-2, chloroplastic n=1 Tax=Spyridia filamentosa TaxID=196632 RepID=A0A1Z1MK46_SPYFI|nr:translation initiation factor 2 [Spyridia filamentosa]ARW66212.1 translation initiation factor 2 [Spyridia filamentosa]